MIIKLRAAGICDREDILIGKDLRTLAVNRANLSFQPSDNSRRDYSIHKHSI
jgi:hypothetical protein